MKIVFLNRYFFPDYSATSQLLSDLAFDLADRDMEVHVITGRQRYDNPKEKLASSETIRRVKIHRLGFTSFGREKLSGRLLDYLSFYVSCFFCLLKNVSAGDRVVVKTDPPMISVVAMVAIQWKRAQQINWVQDLFPELATALLVKARWSRITDFLKVLRNISYQSSLMNVVIGEQMAKRLLGEGISADRVKVISNWSDGEKVRPIARELNLLRKEWQLDGKFVVGYSGNFGRAHDFLTLLDAAEILKEDKNFIFLLIGDGYKLPWIKNEVKRRRLSNFVFKPYQDDNCLSESLSAADVHIISLYPDLEGLIFPSKFYGIAAAGRAVIYIGKQDGEIAEVLSREKIGYAFRVGESKIIAERLLGLSGNPNEWYQMGLNIRAFFERSLNRRLRLNQWKDLLCFT